MAQQILCVDPDADAREETVERLRADLTDIDATVETAGGHDEAETHLNRETAVLITEYDLPDGTGFELIDRASDVAPDAGCILYTETDPDGINTDELRGTVTEYVGKGSVFGGERLTQLVQTTVETRTQSSYPVPQNEDERLAALQSYDLDDPELMASLDRITDLAATHFGVEQASINIINEHSQDSLACYGDAADWETMDRENSICTFTILEDEGVMSVEDATEDPRFESRSESLRDLGIRAYLGANLVASTGLVVGPLCVYDDEPRSFSGEDEQYLKQLADVAMDLIETHAQLGAGGEQP